LQRLRAGSPSPRDTGSLSQTRIAAWREDLRTNESASIDPDAFQFHHHTPPLRSIDYASLSPSRSIRMPLVSMIADLDRYTAYIDRCMATGRIGEAVRLLHILRSEFNAVLQQDFDGRKVRFIGDSIHGVLAEGTSRETDEAATITLAARCAGALRSSFKLCQELLPEALQLGLAIGFECGPTPISRIGIRGDRAVRTATSRTVRASERCQRACNGEQTMIGDAAHAKATPAIRRLFGPTQIANDLTYDDVATQSDAKGVSVGIAGAATILSQPVYAAVPARAYVG
jgi:class 3 adenylate cyclase